MICLYFDVLIFEQNAVYIKDAETAVKWGNYISKLY